MRTKYQIAALALAALFLVATAFALPPQQAQSLTITDGPRIEDVSSHSAEIAWTTSTGGSSIVHYGTDANNLSQTAESPYTQARGVGQHATHRVKIDNLQPNTTYYFVVESGQGQTSGGTVKSPVGQFMTTGAGASDKVPLYRALSPAGGHLFTHTYAEWKKAISSGYKDEGVAGYLERKQAPGTQPLYRLYNPSIDDHFYTADANERAKAAGMGWQDEGVAGYVATSQQPGTAPLYRLRDAKNQHFYTADPSERQMDLQRGWQDEGTVGYIWPH